MTKVLYKGKEVDIKYRNDVIFKKILADDDKESRMVLSFLLSAVTHRSFVHLTVMNSEMISQFSSLTGKTILISGQLMNKVTSIRLKCSRRILMNCSLKEFSSMAIALYLILLKQVKTMIRSKMSVRLFLQPDALMESC